LTKKKGKNTQNIEKSLNLNPKLGQFTGVYGKNNEYHIVQNS
jgi:hypothetical protein